MVEPTFMELVPFHFWTVTFFVFGCIVGSFLNVCIHRLPRGESVARPPSHCPHCGYSIPWYLNIPLFTWLFLRGRCANCKAPISVRYFLVELLTGVAFAACWLKFGQITPAFPLALVNCLILAGLIVATFIDLEHMIIPDQITFGGMVAGLFCSFFVPALHFRLPQFTRLTSPGAGLVDSFTGMAVGAGVIYGVLRIGKLFLGRQKVKLPAGSRIFFLETGVKLPEEQIAYQDLFYRKSDAIVLKASRVELIDRCYGNTTFRLTGDRLQIGEDSFDPEKVLCLEVETDGISLPREVMGFGDVTFMAAIGAFLGWPAIVFCLAISAALGTVISGALVLVQGRGRSTVVPYGPYIAAAAVIWIFGGYEWMRQEWIHLFLLPPG